ncbi:MAG: hypothetical protein HY516_03605 [Candidatus Aenigmarchaeota archaeon]|nr:hypothetical protein [Candidatus Aenigmarchaeota archaeon]
MTSFEVYRARFTPAVADDRGYADPDAAHRFESEMIYRLAHIRSELTRIGDAVELSPDKRMLKIRGSVNLQRPDAVLFYFAGFKDTEKAPDGRYSCETEIALATNSSKMAKWLEETLERDAGGIKVSRELKYIKVREKPGKMPDVDFAEFMTI